MRRLGGEPLEDEFEIWQLRILEDVAFRYCSLSELLIDMKKPEGEDEVCETGGIGRKHVVLSRCLGVDKPAHLSF